MNSTSVLFSILLVLLVFISFSSIVSAQCFQGIDGVCDYNCIEVDFDCIENPNQEGIIYEEQESLGTQDVAETFVENTGENNLLENGTDSFSEVIIDFVFEDEDLISPSEIEYVFPDEGNEDEYFEIIKETKNEPWSLWLILGGFISVLVLLGIILLIYLRVKHSKRVFSAQQNQLIDYILKLRYQKYSDAQIKKLFLDRGYTEQFINGLFKELKF